MPRLPRHPRSAAIALALGAVIRVARRNKRLKSRQLAARLGVKPQAISAWECGKNIPSISAIFLLSEALDVRVSQLFSAAELAVRFKEKQNGQEVHAPGVPAGRLPVQG